ncbi:MAG TPA: class I SAM-dependent methyltransferase [Sedimenticola sp.]|nr:class I SAM-dependent methyltransferase [Sedimenticola sp.]
MVEVMAKVLKHSIRLLLDKSQLGRRLLKAYGHYNLSRQAASFGDAKAFFTHIYQTNLWGSAESASGPGSTVGYTENLRRELADLVRRLNIRRILDAPCGDFNWFRFVDLPPGTSYVGGDIVASLVACNQERYGDDTRTFCVIDIRHDLLPPSDLWICRDVLFHLSNADIRNALENFGQSDISYLLTSTHPTCRRNSDIPTGSYRDLNLEIEPFCFPPPVIRIDDWIDGFPVRQMGLWRREDLIFAGVVRCGISHHRGEFDK